MKPKSPCDGCGHMHRTHTLVIYHGKRLCNVCYQKESTTIPYSGTEKVVTTTKFQEMFKYMKELLKV